LDTKFIIIDSVGKIKLHHLKKKRGVNHEQEIPLTVTHPLYRAGRQLDHPVGRIAAFDYDNNDQLISITDPASRITSYAYDNAGQLTSIIYPDAKLTSFLYQDDNLSQITAHDNSYITFEYDAAVKMDRATQHDKAGAEVNFLEFAYENGNVVVTDKNENSNTYLFDATGSVHSVTNQHGQTQFYMYNALPSDPDEADRNMYQQLQSTSDLQTIANNLLKNHGFEETHDWAHYQAPDGTGAGDYTTDVSAYGERSYKIESLTTTTRDAAGQTVTGIPGEFYTLSADVLVADILDTIQDGGAWIGFDYLQNGQRKQFKGNVFTRSEGWERFSTTFMLPSDADAEFNVYLALESASGNQEKTSKTQAEQ